MRWVIFIMLFSLCANVYAEDMDMTQSAAVSNSADAKHADNVPADDSMARLYRAMYRIQHEVTAPKVTPKETKPKSAAKSKVGSIEQKRKTKKNKEKIKTVD